ncbi:hypothetical protein OEG84_03360 [Hoeflea sp. G2-23]|uniref:LuxR family transcriptional regulator n=1 Tax=Hoeflea algicola TaxID=2983763 RepID=A0ABT3Z4U4_9HYPH|nr:hypothetical protein [Hoeflea algicola]MCY0146780.1 hypothetical protein [Hoeflea algicola]
MSELLVDAIYEASVITKNWPAILCRLANLIGGSHGVLVSTTGTKFDWVASSEAYSEIVKHNYRHPEGPNRTRMLLEKKHSGFLTESDIWTDAELSQSSLYQDFLYPRSLGRSAATAIFTPNGDSFILHTDSPPSLGPITPEQIAVLDEYRPHLARAVLLSARLGFERAVAAANALDCAFRSIRPAIPITSGHLNRGIRPPLYSGCEA